jgi:hypothetical protein
VNPQPPADNPVDNLWKPCGRRATGDYLDDHVCRSWRAPVARDREQTSEQTNEQTTVERATGENRGSDDDDDDDAASRLRAGGMIVAVTDADVALADEHLTPAFLAGFIAYRGGDVRAQVRAGMLAEIATARAFHVEWRPPAGRPDGGIDLWLGARSLQVKWNHYRTGDFYCRPDQPMRADLGVLVVPHDARSVRLRGWLSRAQYEAWETPTSYGYNTVHAVRADQLRPIETLLDRWLSRPFAPPGYVAPANLGGGA